MSAIYDYCLARLKRNPNAKFADIRDDAKSNRIRGTLYPVSYGRAKAQLGLVKTKKKAKADPMQEAATAAAVASEFADAGSTEGIKLQRGEWTVHKAEFDRNGNHDVADEVEQLITQRDDLNARIERIREMVKA